MPVPYVLRGPGPSEILLITVLVSEWCVVLNKSTLEKRAVSETALEKRGNFRTAPFPQLKGHFDWRAKKLCLLEKSICN